LSTIAPIRPEDVPQLKKLVMPPAVIETFNSIIAKHYLNGKSNFTKDEVVKALEEKGMSRHDIYDNKWLDIEDLYRAEGWHVRYQSSGYSGDTKAMYYFTAK
jgi:hypothetical protein